MHISETDAYIFLGLGVLVSIAVLFVIGYGIRKIYKKYKCNVKEENNDS